MNTESVVLCYIISLLCFSLYKQIRHFLSVVTLKV